MTGRTRDRPRHGCPQAGLKAAQRRIAGTIRRSGPALSDSRPRVGIPSAAGVPPCFSLRTVRYSPADGLRCTSLIFLFGQESPGDKKKATTWETSATCPPNACRVVPRNFPGCSVRSILAACPISPTPYLVLTCNHSSGVAPAILRLADKPKRPSTLLGCPTRSSTKLMQGNLLCRWYLDQGHRCATFSNLLSSGLSNPESKRLVRPN
jgi:hypothetical protein